MDITVFFVIVFIKNYIVTNPRTHTAGARAQVGTLYDTRRTSAPTLIRTVERVYNNNTE